MTQVEAGSAMAGNPAEGVDRPVAGNGNGGATGNGAAQSPAEGAFVSLDADMRSFAENKGWHKDHNPVAAVLKSYRELEGRLGSAVTVPEEGDTEAWRKVYGKLGMPDKPEAYALNLPEKHDSAVAGQVRGLFHEAGLSQAQAAKIYDGYAAMVAPHMQAAAEAEAADKAEAEAAVKELGEAKMTAAKMAYRRFMGERPEDAEAMEKVMGSGRMLRFFAGLAEAVGEDGKGALGIGGGKGSGPDGKYTVRDLVNEAFITAKT